MNARPTAAMATAAQTTRPGHQPSRASFVGCRHCRAAPSPSATSTYSPVCLMRMEMPAARPAMAAYRRSAVSTYWSNRPDAHKGADEQPPRRQCREIVWKTPAKREPGAHRGANRLQISAQDEVHEQLCEHSCRKQQPSRVKQVDARQLENHGVHPRKAACIWFLVVDVRDLAPQHSFSRLSDHALVVRNPSSGDEQREVHDR